MKKNIFRKGLVIGIILLFLGAGIIPTVSSNTENKTKDKNILYYSDSPVVTITFPVDRWARGNQTINGTANDPDGIVLVQVAIVENGTTPGEDDWMDASGTTSWSYIWYTYNYIECHIRYDIYARAKNINENLGYADPKTNMEIDNTPPLIFIIKPMKGTITIFNIMIEGIYNWDKTKVIGPFGGVKVKILATDPNHDVGKIDDNGFLFHWGTNLDSVIWEGGPFWECHWDVWRTGTYEVYAECKDRAGNRAETEHYDVYYFNI